MEVIGLYLNNIRAAIRFLSSSTVVSGNFKQYCVAQGVKPKKIGLDMKVRWNSTYMMLKALEGYENLLTVFVNANSQEAIVLTPTDWMIANEFRIFLKPFYKSSKMLSGVYYPTSCLVIEYIWLMAESLNKYRNHEYLRHVVEKKFIKYFQSISHAYCFATIFDPRRKLQALQEAMDGIGEAIGLDYSEAFEHVKKELFRVFRLYSDKHGVSGGTRLEVTRHSKESTTAHLWERKKPQDSSSTSSQSSTTNWNPIAELNHYLDHNFEATDGELANGKDVNLLLWWKNSARIFPVLCHFARDVLLVPVSTVSSEETFSMVGRIIEERRSSLTPEMVEAIACLKDWNNADKRQQHQLEDPEILAALADLAIVE
jgi:hypothetical protein